MKILSFLIQSRSHFILFRKIYFNNAKMKIWFGLGNQALHADWSRLEAEENDNYGTALGDIKIIAQQFLRISFEIMSMSRTTHDYYFRQMQFVIDEELVLEKEFSKNLGYKDIIRIPKGIYSYHINETLQMIFIDIPLEEATKNGKVHEKTELYLTK